MSNVTDHIQRVIEHYNELAHIGPYSTLAPHNKGGRKSQYVSAVFDHAILSAMPTGSRFATLLDYGCGTGIFMRTVSHCAKEVIGIDISPGMLEQARETCRNVLNVHLLQGDGCQVALPDQSVDCIVTREVLCYLPDEPLRRLLAEFWRVTRAGGHLMWLDQVSDDENWQHSPKTPNIVKRPPAAIRNAALAERWVLLSEHIIRTPRFPWIYPIWFGLLPRKLIPRLASWEVKLQRRAEVNKPRPRWRNELFIFQKART